MPSDRGAAGPSAKAIEAARLSLEQNYKIAPPVHDIAVALGEAYAVDFAARPTGGERDELDGIAMSEREARIILENGLTTLRDHFAICVGDAEFAAAAETPERGDETNG